MPVGADTPLVDTLTREGAEAGAEPADASERPTRDKRPRPRSKSKQPKRPPAHGAVLKARSKVLEGKLAELLTFPAVPATMVASDPYTTAYMIEHFTRSGPRTAAALVEASETNPQLRELLERITTGGSLFAVVLALLAYAAPPAMWAFGMREQAARFTQATTMDEAQLARMMSDANAAAEAQSEAAESAEANGAPTAAPGADPLGPEPPA